LSRYICIKLINKSRDCFITDSLMGGITSEKAFKHCIWENSCEYFKYSDLIYLCAVFDRKFAFLFALFLDNVHALFGNSRNFWYVLDDKIIVENSIHNSSFSFPLFSLTESNAIAKRPHDILNHSWHFIMVINIFRLKRFFSKFRT